MLNKLLFIIIIILVHFSFTSSAQDSNLYCQDGKSQNCCSFLAHRVANQHSSKCGTVVLTNNSGKEIILDAVSPDDGRWINSTDYDGGNGINITCYPRNLNDNEVEAMSTVTSRFLGRVDARVSFNIDDSIKSNFIITWKVPTIFASPEVDFNFQDSSSYDKYEVKNETKSFEGCAVFEVTINKTGNNVLLATLVISFSCIVIIGGMVLCYYCGNCSRRRRTAPEIPRGAEIEPENEPKGSATIHEEDKKTDVEQSG